MLSLHRDTLLMTLEDSCTSFGTLEDTNTTMHKPLHHQIESLDHAGNQEEQYQAFERSVHFEDFDEIVDHVSRKDMTENELYDSWHNYEELRAMKMDCVCLVGMLDDGMKDLLQEDDDFCLRGLEQHGGESGKRRCDARRELYDSVLEIQTFSTFQGTPIPDGLVAKAASQHSEALVQEARTLGLLDALEVVANQAL